MATRNLTIMFTDIKGFTERVSDGSREALTSLRSLHDRLLIPVFNHFEGNIVKTIGDAFLVCFNSPTDAVMCGVTIQEVLRQHNAFADEKERLEIKIAINSGEVEVVDNDVLGEPVNIAARLEGVAEAGEVYFTEAVYLSMNRNEAPSAEIGERSFKGIPYPVKIYKTILEPETELSRRLAEGIKFTDQGPVIKGLHLSQDQGKFKLVVAGISAAVILVACVSIFLLPDRYDRAFTKATHAMENNTPALALDIIDPLLKKSPDKEKLIGIAIKAATLHMDTISITQSTSAALEWLIKELKTKPYLEPLRSKVPVLDATAVAEQVIKRKSDSKWCNNALKKLLERYPKNPEVPYKTANLLMGNIFMGFPLWLYTEALNRGIKPDNTIYMFCISLFESNHPGWLESAHSIIETHYNDKGTGWAISIMDTDTSGNYFLYENAWRILNRVGDPRTENHYFISIMNLVNGYSGSQDTVDTTINTFLSQKDPLRKKQVMALARKRATYRSGFMEEVDRTLKELEGKWGVP